MLVLVMFPQSHIEVILQDVWNILLPIFGDWMSFIFSVQLLCAKKQRRKRRRVEGTTIKYQISWFVDVVVF